MNKPTDVNSYIADFPKDVQVILNKVRATIQNAAPAAEEVISYGIPAYRLHGMLVWFGAHTKHIGLYPRGSAIEAFAKELAIYKSAKGSVQFPFDKPMPLTLIAKMVKFRVKENSEKAMIKKK